VIESAVELVVSRADDESHGRLRGWMRAIWAATATALAGNALTVMLTSLLAFVLLHRARIEIGADWDLVSRQAAFFEPVLGRLAPLVFSVAVIAFFADTWSLAAGAASHEPAAGGGGGLEEIEE
jgi:hypothetical protein